MTTSQRSKLLSDCGFISKAWGSISREEWKNFLPQTDWPPLINADNLSWSRLESAVLTQLLTHKLRL